MKARQRKRLNKNIHATLTRGWAMLDELEASQYDAEQLGEKSMVKAIKQLRGRLWNLMFRFLPLHNETRPDYRPSIEPPKMVIHNGQPYVRRGP